MVLPLTNMVKDTQALYIVLSQVWSSLRAREGTERAAESIILLSIAHVDALNGTPLTSIGKIKRRERETCFYILRLWLCCKWL